MEIWLFAIFILIPCSLVFAEDRLLEKYYQEIWCREHDGEMEVTYPDRTRADCETDTHSVEVKFAKGWYNSVGQALWYAAQSGKRAGIVLIIGDDGFSEEYWIKLNSLVSIYSLPIDLWCVYTY